MKVQQLEDGSTYAASGSENLQNDFKNALKPALNEDRTGCGTSIESNGAGSASRVKEVKVMRRSGGQSGRQGQFSMEGQRQNQNYTDKEKQVVFMLLHY